MEPIGVTTLEGEWILNKTGKLTIVNKIIDDRTNSLSYIYSEEDRFNTGGNDIWIAENCTFPTAISKEVLDKLEMPSFLEPGDIIIIHVTKSGKYYIDDNT